MRILSVSDSSNIQEVEYDHASKVMFIHFANDSTYMYKNVPASIFGLLAGAESIGQAFAGIRSDFPGKRVE